MTDRDTKPDNLVSLPVRIDCDAGPGLRSPLERQGYDCPAAETHTPCPEGYMDRIRWFKRMAKTHRQTRCPKCLLWAIWVPKGARVVYPKRTCPGCGQQRAIIGAGFGVHDHPSGGLCPGVGRLA